MSLELLLDAASEAAVRDDWERLREGGHSSLAASTAVANRPHITAVVRTDLPVPELSPLAGILPLEIRMLAPIVFSHSDEARRGILVRPIRLTPELDALHRRLHAICGPGEDMPHTAPGAWTPHVTLARRLILSQTPLAIALLSPPRDATIVGVRRWDAARRESRVLWTA
ncbi:2'-5' RNA ligase family protein [Microbacterium sp. NPDC077184]|uniref:2'-5' RNA ligase family protein n=1 Tax=Microbacterium sp. NPDC077184 TaxID=3154764 RepID=UPI003424B8DE